MYQKFKNFLLTLNELLMKKLKWRNVSPPPPPTSQPHDVEKPPDPETDINTPAAGEGQANQVGGRKPPALEGANWTLLVLGLYFAFAGVTLQALQATGPLPIGSQLVCSALVLALVAFLFSIRTFPDHQFASIVFIAVGIFFGATALVVPLVRNLHWPLMWAMVSIYVSAIVAILFSSVSKIVGYLTSST